jgi:mitochondrial import inner membrane translocase subunit TIM16
MAPVGPVARLLAQIIVPVIAVVAKAIPEAYAQALANARKTGVKAAASEASSSSSSSSNNGGDNSSSSFNPLASMQTKNRIGKEEAMAILNIAPVDVEKDPQKILQQYEKYMNANQISNGGSFYLQSKIFRAKEMLEEYIQDQHQQQQQGSSKSSSTSSSSSSSSSSSPPSPSS